jgi:hypothetical protein
MLSKLLPILPVLIVIAVVLGTCAVAVWMLIVLLLNRIEVALEPPPVKRVRQFFRQHFPNESLAWLRLAAEEESRWVVGVFFGDTRPPNYKFFAMSRASGEISELEDCSQYAPKRWR